MYHRYMARMRRSPLELRYAIVQAAEQAFAREGYGSVSVKQIAHDAGVAESVLYRHFPSKTAIFREAVLLPLVGVLESFSEAAARYSEYDLDDRSMMRLVVGSLFDQLGAHRAALRSVVSADDSLNPEQREELHQALGEVLTGFTEVARQEAAKRGATPPGLGIDLTARALVGTVISLVIFDEWLLRGLAQSPSRTDLRDHLVEMTLRASGARTD
jgi:AcrR family transcriptional regulator